MKMLVNFLCCFIPDRNKREEIRNRLLKSKQRLKKLKDCGCTIKGETGFTKEGIKFDISDYAKVSAHIEEILVNESYNLTFKDEAVIIDIGMNRAIATLFFAAKKNVKKVYAFEPFAPTMALARKNLELNPEINKKVRTFTCGIGRGNKELEIPYSINLSDCMSTTHSIKVKKNVRTETVKVKDAAEVFAPILEENKGSRIIVKCDCEGAEFEIIERLNERNLIKRIDAFLMEYHFAKPDGLVKVLNENGFATHVIHGSRKEPITGFLYAVQMKN